MLLKGDVNFQNTSLDIFSLEYKILLCNFDSIINKIGALFICCFKEHFFAGSNIFYANGLIGM